VHHALDHFVDGAVAARRDNQTRAARNVFARDRPGGARTGGGSDGDSVAVFLKNRDRAIEQRGPRTPEFSGPRIVYKDSVAMWRDGFSPRALFKL
jgi:hypothetical protein